MNNVHITSDGKYHHDPCINPHDEATRQRLATEYIRSLCDYQLKISKLHFGRTATKMSRWCTSSPLKWGFINAMTVAKIDNSGYTITELQDLLDCSRTQVNRMIDECLAEDWVVSKQKSKYQATDFVMTVSHEYLHNYLVVMNQSNVVKAGVLYRNFLAAVT